MCLNDKKIDNTFIFQVFFLFSFIILDFLGNYKNVTILLRAELSSIFSNSVLEELTMTRLNINFAYKCVWKTNSDLCENL